MTIKTSGPISFYDIITEFGGDFPISFANYYRGGPNVPVNIEASPQSFTDNPPEAPSRIPTSGRIHMSQFYGTKKITSTIENRSWNTSYSHATSANALCWISISPNGTLTCYRGTSPNGSSNQVVASQNYYSPTTTGIGSNYWFRATVLSGALTSGSAAVNTWLQITSSYAYNCVASAAGSATDHKQVTVKIEFSNTSNGSSIFATGIYDMSSDAETNI